MVITMLLIVIAMMMPRIVQVRMLPYIKSRFELLQEEFVRLGLADYYIKAISMMEKGKRENQDVYK